MAVRSTPPRRGTQLPDRIAERIGTAILTGRYQPGETLPGEIVAKEEYNVSRSAYREAIRVLGAMGLVDTRKKAGTRVCARSEWNLLNPTVLHWMLASRPPSDFLDALFEVRRVIEPAAAAMAAERRSSEHVAQLENAIAVMRRGVVDSPPYQAADGDFHRVILEATGNEVLLRLNSIVSASLDYVATYKREQHVPRDPASEHEALLSAIARGDADGARDAMERHNHHAREDTLSGLEDAPGWQASAPTL